MCIRDRHGHAFGIHAPGRIAFDWQVAYTQAKPGVGQLAGGDGCLTGSLGIGGLSLQGWCLLFGETQRLVQSQRAGYVRHGQRDRQRDH